MKTKKQIETEKWVDEYIEKYKYPPTYQMIKKQFKIDASAAHFRCRNFRDKMKKNGQQIKLGRYDLLEQRISELENKIEQLSPTIN